jgi:hypothetical protein
VLSQLARARHHFSDSSGAARYDVNRTEQERAVNSEMPQGCSGRCSSRVAQEASLDGKLTQRLRGAALCHENTDERDDHAYQRFGRHCGGLRVRAKVQHSTISDSGVRT